MKELRTLLVLAAFLPLVACGTSGTENNDDGHATNNGTSGHQNHDTTGGDVEVDEYADGMSREGHMGNYMVELVSADPGPPDVGDNTWTVRVTRDGTPVDDATVTVSPFMPAHGHGTSPADYEGTFTEDGTYEAGPFDLFMPGVWETTITVTGSDDTEDMVKFAFELEG